MTVYRVLKDHDFSGQRGEPVPKRAGSLVDVLNRYTRDKLLLRGIIGPVIESHTRPMGERAERYSGAPRIGIWLKTSLQYSGGRIHLFQYAWTLADLGAEVFMITDRMPRWAGDYPAQKNLQILIDKPIPDDLDIVVTDSKDNLGKKALTYAREHPGIPFICMSFETPNWVKEYCPDYAAKLQAPKEVFNEADYLLANSQESAKYLLEWVDSKAEAGVLHPAVNTFALTGGHPPILPTNPYALFSARSAPHKQSQLAVDAIWDLDFPFDLVVFGRLQKAPRDNGLHKLHTMTDQPDSVKFVLMKGAHMTLAPSLFEGFGMVPAESLCSGTPCIAFDLPVLQQVYGDQITLVEWNKPNKFKRAVERMANAEKQEVNTKKAIKYYGMDAMKRQVEQLKFHAIKKPYLSVQLIAYWGFLPESLESIYEYADEINIAYGRVQAAGEIDDGTLDKLKDFPDPENKIKLKIRDDWPDKLAMRSWCVKNSTGNYLLLLDGDEVWTGLEDWLAGGIKYGCPKWVNFWHGPDHWVYDDGDNAGFRWGYQVGDIGSICPHYRYSYWRRSYYFMKHPTPVDKNKHPLHLLSPEAAKLHPETIIWHLGHALTPNIMRMKHEFYRKRDGDDPSRRKRQSAWEVWDGKCGTCGDGIVQEVKIELPDIVRRAFR